MHNKKAAVALLSVISNTILVVFKLIIGIMIGSVSVISEAIHSGVDLLAAIIALFAVRASAQPADKDHPFGHGKFENVSGTVEALLIFVAAIWIIFEAFGKLRHPEPLEAAGWGIGVMLLSAVANYIVSHMLFKVGRETDSPALQADGWHLRTDVYTSAGVMGGLAIIWIGEKLFPGARLHWIDPLAAILVAMLIIKAAWDLTIESGKDLLDVSIPPEEEEWICNYIKSQAPTVNGFHHLRTRKAGAERFVEVHLVVDADMSVDESHAIGDKIVAAVKERYPGTRVIVHIEPCDGLCTNECHEGCLLTPEERKNLTIEG